MKLKLKNKPYAQAHVIYESEDDITLVSYTTKVLQIKNGMLKVNGLYSRTTRIHISTFMDEYTDKDYYYAKSAFEQGKELPITVIKTI